MTVQKGAEPLGMSIVSGENGGVFVSKVTAGSIAHQAHLEYGDQLLEVTPLQSSKPSFTVFLYFCLVPNESIPFPVQWNQPSERQRAAGAAGDRATMRHSHHSGSI